MKLKKLLKYMDPSERIILMYNSDVHDNEVIRVKILAKDIQQKYLNRKIASIRSDFGYGNGYLTVVLKDKLLKKQKL